MIKMFAKWLFIKTHDSEIQSIISWGNYHYELGDKKIDIDSYHYGIYNGINNAIRIFDKKM